MGNLTSRVFDDYEKRMRTSAIESQIMLLRKEKKSRDAMIATRIATTRERVWWLAGFYGTMGTASLARMIYLKRVAPFPLDFLPFVLVPFLFAYQFDFAYLDKANRIQKMSEEILEDPSYWFNEPIALSSEEQREIYLRVYNDLNEKRRKLGLPEEKHWCK